MYAPSQWETMVHYNIISHWLGAYIKWFLLPHSHHNAVNFTHSISISKSSNKFRMWLICALIDWLWQLKHNFIWGHGDAELAGKLPALISCWNMYDASRLGRRSSRKQPGTERNIYSLLAGDRNVCWWLSKEDWVLTNIFEQIDFYFWQHKYVDL